MKNEPAVTNKLLELYKEQEEYDSYDKTIEINTLRWVLDKDVNVLDKETEESHGKE